MNISLLTRLVMALALPLMVADAKSPQGPIRAGDVYEITKTRDSVSQGSESSSGSSHDQDTIIERVEAIRPDGFEVVFDLPEQVTKEDRQQAWQFPARLFQPHVGPSKLLNAPDLENRLAAWLTLGKLTREACGHWIFTWNAFKIECDPESVVKTVEGFDPRLPELRAGAIYQDAHALRPAPLAMTSSGSGTSIFAVTLAIDPKAIQREGAEADVVIGEILRKPVALDSALVERAKEEDSGTIKVTIEANAGGNLRRLKKVTELHTKKPDGTVKTERVTETIERRLLSSSKA